MSLAPAFAQATDAYIDSLASQHFGILFSFFLLYPHPSVVC